MLPFFGSCGEWSNFIGDPSGVRQLDGEGQINHRGSVLAVPCTFSSETSCKERYKHFVDTF
jgi:hypothetical protein